MDQKLPTLFDQFGRMNPSDANSLNWTTTKCFWNFATCLCFRESQGIWTLGNLMWKASVEDTDFFRVTFAENRKLSRRLCSHCYHGILLKWYFLSCYIVCITCEFPYGSKRMWYRVEKMRQERFIWFIYLFIWKILERPRILTRLALHSRHFTILQSQYFKL